MATGLPVVATSIMGVPELVDHERTGLLVAPGRGDQLATALARLVADPDLRARLGAQARRRVETDYDGARQVRALRAALSPLLR
jgi:glycosyltransferase involved in cell wall biosynthesis